MMLFFLNLYKVYVPHSLRTADAFPIVASLRSDDRKCVFCSQAMYPTSYDMFISSQGSFCTELKLATCL